jgi:rhodanese-related sulfurtransferase
MIRIMSRLLPAFLILMVCFPATSCGQTAATAELLGGVSIDPFPPGKSLHFLAGMALGLAAAGIADYMADPQLRTAQPFSLPFIALTASGVGGAVKEILDLTGFGDPRFTDILITMSGGLAASLAAGYAEGLYPSTLSGRANGTSFLVSMALGASIPVVIGFVREIRAYRERRAKAASFSDDASRSLPSAETYVDPGVLYQLISSPGRPYFLVDVRTAEEYETGHIPTALNIPYDGIGESPPTADKDALIIVYCASGHRSMQAKAALVKHGYVNICDFGALARWTGAIVTGDQPGACPCPPAPVKEAE